MSALRDWYTRHNPGTVSGTGGDVKLSPDQVNSLAHTDQAESWRKSCRFDIEAYAVVGNFQT
jgi:hypothetical protein